MPAYVIVRVEVTDPEAYKTYTAQTPDAIAAAGGRFIVRGGPVQTLEGPEENRRIVVIEFPSLEAAHAFYESPDYGPVMALRHAAANSEMILVDGA